MPVLCMYVTCHYCIVRVLPTGRVLLLSPAAGVLYALSFLWHARCVVFGHICFGSWCHASVSVILESLYKLYIMIVLAFYHGSYRKKIAVPIPHAQCNCTSPWLVHSPQNRRGGRGGPGVFQWEYGCYIPSKLQPKPSLSPPSLPSLPIPSLR